MTRFQLFSPGAVARVPDARERFLSLRQRDTKRSARARAHYARTEVSCARVEGTERDAEQRGRDGNERAFFSALVEREAAEEKVREPRGWKMLVSMIRSLSASVICRAGYCLILRCHAVFVLKICL